MAKGWFWQKDWFVGLLVSLIFLLSAHTDLMQSLERKAYDLGMLASSRTPSDKIAIIAIDERSIANLGRWPWPRAIHAQMLDVLTAGHPKVIGYTVFFFEPQLDAGLGYISRIAELLSNSKLKDTTDPVQQAELAQLAALLQEASQNLDNDQKLSESISKANDVLLAMFFELGEPHGKPDQDLPDYVLRNKLTTVSNARGTAERPVPAVNVLQPIAPLGRNALALGHLNNFPDIDGAIRTEPLVVDYYNQYYPSLSLILAAKSLNLEYQDIKINLGEGVQMGNQKIATDPDLRMHTYFYKDKDGRPAFPVDSFYDVLSGKIPAEKYRDKIVLIGASAAGVGSLQVTPISSGMAPVLTLAHSLSSILKGDFFVTPRWADAAQIGIFLLVALYLIVVLPHLNAAMGALLTGTFLITLLAAHFVLMTMQAMWLQLMLPAALLLVGHLLLTTKRFLMTEKGKQKSDARGNWISPSTNFVNYLWMIV
jgi:CHASE2 domain-containing sensor protein